MKIKKITTDTGGTYSLVLSIDGMSIKCQKCAFNGTGYCPCVPCACGYWVKVEDKE